jgi:hypothetical protein
LNCRTCVLSLLAFLAFVPVTLPAAERREDPETCTYTLAIWNSRAGKVTRTIRIERKYSEITEEERDRSATGCTVCSEDQVRIKLPGLDSFSVCHVIADRVEGGLRDLIAQGEPIFSVSGYRPVRSKGSLNADGERTELSNHAFGTAIDINRMHNGLYENCYEWSPECRLIQGGPWRPGESEGSLSPDGPIVRKMKSLGFQWGGEIRASQKDFMHFSLSGF